MPRTALVGLCISATAFTVSAADVADTDLHVEGHDDYGAQNEGSFQGSYDDEYPEDKDMPPIDHLEEYSLFDDDHPPKPCNEVKQSKELGAQSVQAWCVADKVDLLTILPSEMSFCAKEGGAWQEDKGPTADCFINQVKDLLVDLPTCCTSVQTSYPSEATPECIAAVENQESPIPEECMEARCWGTIKPFVSGWLEKKDSGLVDLFRECVVGKKNSQCLKLNSVLPDARDELFEIARAVLGEATPCFDETGPPQDGEASEGDEYADEYGYGDEAAGGAEDYYFDELKEQKMPKSHDADEF